MSSNASGSRTPIGLRDFIDDKRNNPPPYRQEPIVEGFYVEDDTQLILAARKCRRNHADRSDGIEGGFVNPGFQNQPRNSQYPQHPPNPAYPHQLQDGQQSSQSTDPHQPQYGAYGPPPNYTANQDNVNGKLRYDASAPKGMPEGGQQPAYPSPPFHDPRSVAATYRPYATTGQYVITNQPLGQPHAIIVQPIMENPPSDYMGYSMFTAFCCCWLVGFMAVARSRECRTAILDGDRELAEKKSRSARNTANAALGLGILALIVAGVVIGMRFSSLIK